MTEKELILVADIGGTSSRFAEFTSCEGQLQLENSVWLRTSQYQSFLELLQSVQQQFSTIALDDFSQIVIAAAGPVAKGRYCSPPNINWEINLDEVEASLKLPPTALINDFVAQAFAVLSPLHATFDVILPGNAHHDFPKVITGVGTGLGKSALLPTAEGKMLGIASEGGHAALAIEDAEEVAFFNYLLAHTDKQYVEWEDVLSGRGLERVHHFCTGQECDAEALAPQLKQSPATVALFSKFLGRMCRNFILEFMGKGGLYIAGGVIAKNPLFLQSPSFRSSLHAVNLASLGIDQIPVYLMDEQDSGLWGAAMYAKNQMS